MSGGYYILLLGIGAAVALGMLAWPFIVNRDAMKRWRAWPPLL
jgi:hypothetical protein